MGRSCQFIRQDEGLGCANILHRLHPAVRKQLKLKKHGLKLAGRQHPAVSLGPDGRHLVLTGKPIEDLAEAGDRETWPALRRRLMGMANALYASLSQAPPRLGGNDWRDRLALAKLGLRLRLIGKTDIREFLRIVNMNVFDLLSHELADRRLKGALAFDHGKYGEYSAAPALEITITSPHDDGLAGMDRHVMSPPLIITRPQIDEMVEILRRGITESIGIRTK